MGSEYFGLSMSKERISYEHDRMNNPIEYSDAASFILFMVFFIAFIAGGIYITATMLNVYWSFGFVAAVVLYAIIANQISATTAHQQFFNNPDNHSHDDDCHTCGELYGPQSPNESDYIIQAAHVCRHSAGKMDYPQ